MKRSVEFQVRFHVTMSRNRISWKWPLTFPLFRLDIRTVYVVIFTNKIQYSLRLFTRVVVIYLIASILSLAQPIWFENKDIYQLKSLKLDRPIFTGISELFLCFFDYNDTIISFFYFPMFSCFSSFFFA